MASSDSDSYEFEYSDDDDDMMDDDPMSTSQTSIKSGSSPRRSQRGKVANPNAGEPSSTTTPTAGGEKRSADGSSKKKKSRVSGGSNFSDASPHKSDPNGLRLVDAAEMASELNEVLEEVSQLLNIPIEAANVLMRHYKFNKEKLIEQFYEDSEKVTGAAGVSHRCFECPGQPSTPATKGKKQSKKKSTHYCQTCMEDVPVAETYAMSCGHSFCVDCWGGFLENALMDGPRCVYQKCPEFGCNELVTEKEVANINVSLLPKFQSYQLKSFVDLNKLARWCPAPDCTKIGITKSGYGDIKCTCGKSFCIRCGREPHAPVGCAVLERWEDKNANESETANWILANTKKCPKCFTRIEKNQGCNHMTCQQCKYDFCWVCLKPWSEHGSETGGYYKCNRFSEEGDEEGEGDQSDQAKAKRELNKYLHYYQRYHAHDKAQEFAEKSLLETETRMTNLQDDNSKMSYIDVQFLKAANEQLIECRRVLKFTYCHAYYMVDKSIQKNQFENHQEMLEKFTEKLSELSEQPLDKMDRTSVINHTRVVQKFVHGVLEYVEMGMEDE